MYASTPEPKEGGLGSSAASALVLLFAVERSMVEGFVFTTLLPSRLFPGCSPVGSVATADVHGYLVASVWCSIKAAGWVGLTLAADL